MIACKTCGTENYFTFEEYKLSRKLTCSFCDEPFEAKTNDYSHGRWSSGLTRKANNLDEYDGDWGGGHR